MPLGFICTIEHPIILPQKVDVRIEWGHVRNVLITMSGTKWPSSKHHLFLHSLKGLSTYMMFLSLSWVAVVISWATVTSGKDILSWAVLLTAMGLLSVSVSLSPATPLLGNGNVVKPFPTPISWRLKPGVIGRCFAWEPIFSVLSPAKAIC